MWSKFFLCSNRRLIFDPFHSIVNDAQSLYSVMLRLKTTNNFSLFEQIITAIIFLQKTSLSEMISDEKYLKIISLYIDMIFQRRQKSKIENLAIICLENLNPVKQMNIFVQLYLLGEGDNFRRYQK